MNFGGDDDEMLDLDLLSHVLLLVLEVSEERKMDVEDLESGVEVSGKESESLPLVLWW